MNPRPLHRSKTLWLGVFILLSLAWAWLISMDSCMAVEIDTSRGWLSLAQMQGEAGIFAEATTTRGWHLLTTHRNGIGGTPGYQAFWQGIASAHGLIVTTHATLILLFLIPWAAFLAWRWRRTRHLTDSKPAP